MCFPSFAMHSEISSQASCILGFVGVYLQTNSACLSFQVESHVAIDFDPMRGNRCHQRSLDVRRKMPPSI